MMAAVGEGAASSTSVKLKSEGKTIAGGSSTSAKVRREWSDGG